jgi:arylsulfatase A-like enzyme
VLIVMTADHGVAPVPEVNTARRMPGGRVPQGVIRKAVEAALTEKYGDGQWILNGPDVALYFNQDLIRQKKLDPAEFGRVAADAARRMPHVFRAYPGALLATGVAMEDQAGRRVANGFYAPRSPDLYVLLEPYWLYGGGKGTTHGTTFGYDVHVPVVFMGPGFRAGHFDAPATVYDIAPTLATYLNIETPSGAVGRCLAEAMN